MLDKQFQVHDLDDVIRYFAQGFAPKPDGTKIVRSDAYVDVAKGKVIFELLVEKPDDRGPG